MVYWFAVMGLAYAQVVSQEAIVPNTNDTAIENLHL